MLRDEAYQVVCKTFGEYFEVHPTQVLAHHELQRDWGLCSSEIELLAHQIEQRAGVELFDHTLLFELRTVGQLVRLVRAHMRRAAHAGAPSELSSIGDGSAGRVARALRD